jgi:hypothetical protein
VKVRYATAEDLHGWYGGPPPMTMRAVVVEDAGSVVGICGLCRAPDHVQVFSHIKDELRGHWVPMARAAAMVRRMIDGPVLAMQDCAEPTSGRLLQWLGLREIAPGIWVN